MPNFLLAYRGGRMAETPEEQRQQMAAWMEWFGTLGPAVVDPGAPFGASAAVTAEGAGDAAGTGLTGYSIVSAASLEDAAEKAKGCPVLAGGGSVDVYEALPIG